MFRIGVVCEGPTDFWCIREFMEACLSKAGFSCEFIAVQPTLDNTRPEAGWGNVLYWFQKNPVKARMQNWFGGGLFAGSLSRPTLNAMIVQLDSDILGDGSFQCFVRAQYGYEFVEPVEPAERGKIVREVLERACEFGLISNQEKRLHVLAPSVESTETWCIAAFCSRPEEFENLKGDELANRFMHCLEISESRAAEAHYRKIDKSVSRRKRFCRNFKAYSERVEATCDHYRSAKEQLIEVFS